MEEEEIAYRRGQDQYNKDLATGEYLAGVGQFGKLAQTLGLSEEETQALVDRYARENALTEEEAARQVAAWYAQYGDYSKLKEIGVDTGYLEQGRTGQQPYEPPKEPPKEPEVANRHGDSWVEIPGHGRYSYPELYERVQSGQVQEIFDKKKNTYTYKWVG